MTGHGKVHVIRYRVRSTDGKWRHKAETVVLSRDPTPDKPAYQGDIFIFPVRDFAEIIRCGIQSKGRKVYLSRLKGEAERWFLRKKARRFEKITEETCLEVTAYRRNFGALLEDR